MPCVLASRPGCGTQLYLDLGMGWGDSFSYVGWQWSYRAFIEAGVLFGLSRNFQMGPVLDAGLETGRVNSGYSFQPKLKARYWIAGWYIALDSAIGGSFRHFTFDGGTENGTRTGGTAELGLTLFGVVGPYVAVTQLGDPVGLAGSDTIILGGIRGLAGWAFLLAGIGHGFKNAVWF